MEAVARFTSSSNVSLPTTLKLPPNTNLQRKTASGIASEGKAITVSGSTIFSFDARGNQHIESTPSGIKTCTRDFENMRTAVLLPGGSRETMT